MNSTGIVHKFGNDIDTDGIFPGRYLTLSDPSEIAAHCMEGHDPEFVKNCRSGDLIVGGINFGCGSSREQAPLSIKASGVSCVIAKSFSRIFFRNAINIGLPIIESPEAVEKIQPGDIVQVDFDTGEIKNLTSGDVFQSEKFPPFIQKIIAANGLMNMRVQELKE